MSPWECVPGLRYRYLDLSLEQMASCDINYFQAVS